MSFWFGSILIAAAVAAALAFGMLRARPGVSAQAQDMQVYKDQLAEVERDLSRGVIDADEAARLRTEVSRRLLEADRAGRAAPDASSRRTSPLVATALGIAVPVAAFALYTQLGAPFYPDLPLQTRIEMADTMRAERPRQEAAESRVGASQIDPNADPKILELMPKLRQALETRPDDLEGYELLARNEAALGDFIAARKAQQRVIELKGDDATASDYANLAYVQIAAAGGYVSPEAETALSNALRIEPANRLARFYSGLMFAQNDRPDMTFRLWRPLLQDAPPDDPFAAIIRRDIEQIASDAGVRYTLPDAPRGPTSADIEAAEEMSAEDRGQMIRSMVDGLSDRLATEGGPPEDWARLIAALGVLKEDERAAAIWDEAQEVFAENPDALATVRGAASQAGLVQ